MNETWWQAVVNCDQRFDSVFYYGVVTTTIFCKPSCRSRDPQRENVRFFHSTDEARNKGFRACKRCKPEEPKWYADTEIAVRINELIDRRYAEPWTLARFGEELHMSPCHVQRMFSRATNTSPAKALLARRLQIARQELLGARGSITDIALAAGFRSGAHFSSVFLRESGCTPSEYRLTHQARTC
ncbi:MAG: bifunctional transcriptional activator/DNA repair enzyme AdaA [Bacilli bacterium]